MGPKKRKPSSKKTKANVLPKRKTRSGGPVENIRITGNGLVTGIDDDSPIKHRDGTIDTIKRRGRASTVESEEKKAPSPKKPSTPRKKTPSSSPRKTPSSSPRKTPVRQPETKTDGGGYKEPDPRYVAMKNQILNEENAGWGSSVSSQPTSTYRPPESSNSYIPPEDPSTARYSQRDPHDGHTATPGKRRSRTPRSGSGSGSSSGTKRRRNRSSSVGVGGNHNHSTEPTYTYDKPAAPTLAPAPKSPKAPKAPKRPSPPESPEPSTPEPFPMDISLAYELKRRKYWADKKAEEEAKRAAIAKKKAEEEAKRTADEKDNELKKLLESIDAEKRKREEEEAKNRKPVHASSDDPSNRNDYKKLGPSGGATEWFKDKLNKIFGEKQRDEEEKKRQEEHRAAIKRKHDEESKHHKKHGHDQQPSHHSSGAPPPPPPAHYGGPPAVNAQGGPPIAPPLPAEYTNQMPGLDNPNDMERYYPALPGQVRPGQASSLRPGNIYPILPGVNPYVESPRIPKSEKKMQEEKKPGPDNPDYNGNWKKPPPHAELRMPTVPDRDAYNNPLDPTGGTNPREPYKKRFRLTSDMMNPASNFKRYPKKQKTTYVPALKAAMKATSRATSAIHGKPTMNDSGGCLYRNGVFARNPYHTSKGKTGCSYMRPFGL